MGQRSQIYVRYDKSIVVANYYQWNYGERMISRARYGIEYIKDVCLEYKDFIFKDKSYMEKLSRIFDVNFDMKDVAISQDIIEEWKRDFPDDNFNDFVFRFQDNNDGKLLVDITADGIIKYAFLDYNCNTDNIMTGEQYMYWNSKEWEQSKYISSEQKKLCRCNLQKINEMAILMTKEEAEDFVNYDYQSNM